MNGRIAQAVLPPNANGLTCSFNSDDGYIISEMEFGELAFNVLVPVAVLLTGFLGLLIMRL
jgi:hypothetical protein